MDKDNLTKFKQLYRSLKKFTECLLKKNYSSSELSDF